MTDAELPEPPSRAPSTIDAAGSTPSAREVFGVRAPFYRTSKAHTDPAVLARLVEMAHPEPGWIALDLATGAGHAALALAPFVRRVVGLDLTPEMLDQARILREEKGRPAVEFCLGDVEGLPLPAEAFDLVVCRRSAHHFRDLPRALSEMRRVLRPAGRLVVDDRSVPSDPQIDSLMNRLDRLHDPSHVREYPAVEWRAILESSGFAVDGLESYDRLRPLSDLMDGAGACASEEIMQLVETMPSDLAEAFGRVRDETGWSVKHWYVILSAVRM